MKTPPQEFYEFMDQYRSFINNEAYEKFSVQIELYEKILQMFEKDK